ncbi:MAG TPA: CheR family methyltransferase [Candidatus Obscuribacterales bacterium]
MRGISMAATLRNELKDDECVAFLQWALPLMGMRWQGFRRVRGQVKKRIARRLHDLGLDGLQAYREHLERNPSEWDVLQSMCRITISRFYRDHAVFESIGKTVLPVLAGLAESENRSEMRAWSAGCASGEEPYGLLLAWMFGCSSSFPAITLKVLATDVDEGVIARARTAEYGKGSLRELPPEWVAQAFEETGGRFRIRQEWRNQVMFLVQDISREWPEGLFDLILCRNLVLTYFDEANQARVLLELTRRLVPGGVMAIGIHEQIPSWLTDLEPWDGCRAIFRKRLTAT